MIYEKPDGWIQLGYGTGRFRPGEEASGLHTNGSPSQWWRWAERGTCQLFKPRWVPQPDHRDRHWQEMAAAANSCEEFWRELRKSQ